MATTEQPHAGGVLGRRGYLLENVVARICQEAGGRVTTNVLMWDLDLAEPNAADARRFLVAARQREERKNPELVGRRGRARLVVFGCGGLWPVVPRDAKVLEFSDTR